MKSPIQKWFAVGFALVLCVASTKTCTAQTSSNEAIEVTLGDAEPLPARLYIFNTDMATSIAFRGIGYDSPQFDGAVKRLRPQGLRFPGGTLANNYLWRSDSFSAPTNDKTGWAAEPLAKAIRAARPEVEIGACFAPLK